MRTLTGGRWPGIVLGALLLTACSGEKREKVAEAPAGPPPAVTPLTPAPPAEPPIPPETVTAVDTALAAAKAFNAKALTDLAGIETTERRIHDQAARALDAARRGDPARATAARTDALAARKSLADGWAAFQTAATEQQAAVTAAAALCGFAPPLAPLQPVTKATKTAPSPAATPPATVAPAPLAYAGCTALQSEQALLTQNTEAMSARYEAADAAYRQDRPKLEEAAAIVTLGD